MQIAPFVALALLVGASPSQRSVAPRRPKMVVLSVRALDDAVRPTAEMLSEVLLTEIHKSQKFELIGESELASFVGLERQKQLMGCAEASCLAEIGGALGCEYVFLSSLGTVDREYRFDLRLADAKRNVVVARDGAMVGSKSELLTKAKEMVWPLLGSVLAPPAVAAASAPPKIEPEPKAAPPAPAEAQPPAAPAAAAPQEAVATARPAGRSKWLPYSLIGGGAAAAVAGGVLVAATVSGKEELTYSQASGRINAGGAIAGVGIAAALAGGALLLWGGSGDGVAVAAGVHDGPFVVLGGSLP